jgi:hypothetical protein
MVTKLPTFLVTFLPPKMVIKVKLFYHVFTTENGDKNVTKKVDNLVTVKRGARQFRLHDNFFTITAIILEKIRLF